MPEEGEEAISLKKAIVVVSFGTTYPDTLKRNIESTENKIREAFPDFEVRRAFTSRMVIAKLARRDGLAIDNERQALRRLMEEGYQEVFIQPLHLVAGEEYEKVKILAAHYEQVKVFEKIAVGRPLVYYTGQEDKPDDYRIVIEAMRSELPALGSRDALVLMGHGGVHPANTAYAALQVKLEEMGLDRVFVYTVERFPSLGSVMEKLRKHSVRKVTLLPFMLVAGEHAVNDMAGDEEDSAKSQLTAAGFEVEACFRGLGENAAIQDIYVQHLQDAMDQA
jgi:sirohydrochlorin cobaltochelatase